MSSHQRRDVDFARDLIRQSLGDVELKEFGGYPLFSVLRNAFVRSQGSRRGYFRIHALAEDALWRAVSEWLAGRSFPTGSARDTIATAKREGFDLTQRAQEFLSPRLFLR